MKLSQDFKIALGILSSWIIPLALLSLLEKYLSPYFIWYVKENVLGWIGLIWGVVAIFVPIIVASIWEKRKKRKEYIKAMILKQEIEKRVLIEAKDKLKELFARKAKMN